MRIHGRASPQPVRPPSCSARWRDSVTAQNRQHTDCKLRWWYTVKMPWYKILLTGESIDPSAGHTAGLSFSLSLARAAYVTSLTLSLMSLSLSLSLSRGSLSLFLAWLRLSLSLALSLSFSLARSLALPVGSTTRRRKRLQRESSLLTTYWSESTLSSW